MSRPLPPVRPAQRRGAALRAVVEVLDRRLDGVLPADVPGVSECFEDDADLVAALALRWHAALSARLDQAVEDSLRSGAGDRSEAVTRAWATTAEQLRGVRRLLDRLDRQPTSPGVADLVARSTRSEHALLARAAGTPAAVPAGTDERGQAVGRRLLARARTQVRPALADRIRALVTA